MPHAHEIELKFLCAPEDLSRVLAAAPEGDDDTRELISVYFDTPDLDLQRAGASLRVRESRGQRIQTVKRGDGLAREEHETPIAGDVPDPSLEPLPELLPEGAETQLKPAFHVRVTRRQRLVRFDGAEIELAFDEGEVRGAKRTSPISEVELELKSGEPAALFGLAKSLGSAAPLYLSFSSKAARGQALVSGEPPNAQRKTRVRLSGRSTVADAFQAVARASLAGLAANAEALRAGQCDPEAVHQLRVAARTLRSALNTFRKVVADDEYERLKEELRWIARVCDETRNLDVFAEETLKPARALDPPPRGLEALSEAVETAREAARTQVVHAVSSPRFRDLLIDVTGWVDTGAWLEGERAKAPARPFAAHRLNRRRRKLLQVGRDLETLSDAERHEARIQAKKLRYAIEGFQSLFDRKTSQRYLDRLKALQEDLGVLNDIATAEPALAALPLIPDAAFAAGELVGRLGAEKPARLGEAAQRLGGLEKAKPFWR